MGLHQILPAVLLLIAVAKLCLPQVDAALFPSPKGWWAHEMYEDVFGAGRLSARMIKYADELGYKSIISVMAFDEGVDLGDEDWLTTDEEEEVVDNHTAMKFYRVHTVNETKERSWRDSESIARFGPIFDNAERPVLIHCACSWTSSVYVHLHYLNTSKIASVAAMFKSMIDHGYDPKTSDDFVLNVANEIGGESLTNADIPKYEHSLGQDEWCGKYGFMHPVYKNVFIAGQIQSDHLGKVKDAGITDVINLRSTGEEVTLLNVEDDTGDDRQTTENLEKNIIDDTKTSAYISAAASINYEAMNGLEWGDDESYNETLEMEAFKASTVKYAHHDFDLDTMDEEKWKSYLDAWPGKSANILFHDRTGEKALHAALAYLVKNYDMESDWVQERAELLGYEITDAELKKFMDNVTGGANIAGSQTFLLLTLGAICAWLIRI